MSVKFCKYCSANQIYPDEFQWHYASNKFGQGYLSEIILVLPPKIQGLTAFIERQLTGDSSLGVV